MKLFSTIIISLLFLSSLQCQIPHFNWAKSFGDGANVQGKKIAYDPNGFLITAGEFRDSGDFQQGSGTTTLTSQGKLDVFVSKMDTVGGYIWVKSLGSVKNVYLHDLTTDNLGNIYVTGIFDSIMDADPGAGSNNLKAIGFNAHFLIKLSPSGSLIWAHSFSGGAYVHSFPTEIGIDNNQNLIFAGGLLDSIDFDPGPGVSYLVNNGSGGGMFVAKFNTTGSLIWVEKIIAPKNLIFDALDLDQLGNIHITGTFNDSVDFDPGSGATFIGRKNSFDLHSFLLKLSGTGNFIWARDMGSLNPDIQQIEYQDVVVDNNGNVWLTGHFQGTIDVDPGVGVKNLVSTGYNNSFIVKLNSSGNHQWSGVLTSGFNLKTKTIRTNSKDQVLLTGYLTDTADLDPGPNQRLYYSNNFNIKWFMLKLNQNGLYTWSTKGLGATDFIADNKNKLDFVGFFNGTTDFDPRGSTYNLTSITSNVFAAQWEEDTCGDFTIHFDSVQNVSCTQSAYAHARGAYGQPPYTYLWATSPPINDSIATFGASGDYILEVSDSNCTIATTLHIQGPTTSGLNLEQHFHTENLRKGDTILMNSLGFNSGCMPTTSQLDLQLDPEVNYLFSANNPPNSTAGNTLSWNIGLKNIDSTTFAPSFWVKLKNSAKIGDTLEFISTITPFTGDIDTLNNQSIIQVIVVNSYDPNDISVHPLGECPEAYVLKNEKLTYTIRFQNTGNDEARTVVILDSINPAMDLSTLNVISSSHQMHTEIINERVIKFVFNDINLPDSKSNYVESNGNVIFEIYPKENALNGTIVRNKAEIYFDSNEAIITNSVFNTLVDKIPPCNTSISTQSSIKDGIRIYPNPATHLSIDQTNFNIIYLEIIDLSGRIIHTQRTVGNTVNISGLNKGVYILKVITSDKVNFERFVKK